jgi:predicted restriction endonuclease
MYLDDNIPEWRYKVKNTQNSEDTIICNTNMKLLKEYLEKNNKLHEFNKINNSYNLLKYLNKYDIKSTEYFDENNPIKNYFEDCDFEDCFEDYFENDKFIENLDKLEKIAIIRQRLYQTKLRGKCLKIYNYQCLISKTDVLYVLDCCHIIPVSNSEYNQKIDIYNTLLLRTDIHKLFDKYLFSINPYTKRIVFKDKNKISIEYLKYDDMEINIFHNQTLEYLKSHYETFLQKL